MIKAVIFDCDGVLVDSEIIAVEVERALLSEHGLHYEKPDFIARFMGMSDKAFYAALGEDLLARLNRELPADFQTRVNAGKRAISEKSLAVIAGLEQAVAVLRCPTAVASSSHTYQLEYKLRRTGLWDTFAPHIYSADDVTHAKPAPNMFLHAAKALDIAPRDCLVIEDSVNGVKAGLAAGMRVWGFAGGGHMDEASAARLMSAGAERVVPNWAEAALLFAEFHAASV